MHSENYVPIKFLFMTVQYFNWNQSQVLFKNFKRSFSMPSKHTKSRFDSPSIMSLIFDERNLSVEMIYFWLNIFNTELYMNLHYGYFWKTN